MISVDITAEQDKITIESLCKQWNDPRWGEEEAMPDQPRARVEVGHTVGGPNFSSTRVFVSIEVPYNPANVQATEVANKIFDKGLELIDSFIEPSYKNLLRHIENLHGEEDGG